MTFIEYQGVMYDQDLAVSMRSRPDADDGDPGAFGNDLADFRRDSLQKDAEGAGLFEESGILDQLEGAGGVSSLGLETPQGLY